MDTAFSQFPEECSVKHHELETPYTCSSVIVSEKPANSAVLEKLDKVSLQKINCDLNIAVDNEKAGEFAVDEEEGESVEDGDNQGRKHISSLTSRHYAGHVRVFKEWLKSKNISEDFEHWEPSLISNWLSAFYKESHLKHGGTKKASSLRIIRSAIDHHLKSAPYCKSFSLTHSHEFNKANATLHDLEAAQKDFLDSSDCSTSAVPLSVDEIRKLWATGVVGIKTPKSLQRLVFLGIGINFGVTSRDDLRDLKPSMFEFHIDEKTGLEYASCNIRDSLTTQLKKNKNKCSGRQMFSVPGSLQCPVAALKLFLQRRNPACSAFFQIPNRDFLSSGMWYRAHAAGLNCLSGMLKDMSHEALLSMDYSNINLRATPPIVLYKAMEGVPSLCPPRIITETDLNNKIALNSPGHAMLSSVTSEKRAGPTLVNSIPTQTVVVNNSHSITALELHSAKAVSDDFSIPSNLSSPSESIPNCNIPQRLHHVLCVPQQWNMTDIIRAVNSGEALVIAKQTNKREHDHSHESGEVTQLRDQQQQQQESIDLFQHVGRDRSGRKQPEPKRFRRDPDLLKAESSKVDDGYMKAINGIKNGLQILDDLVSKQQPPDAVVQELTQIGDSIQQLLNRININGVVME